MIVVIPPDRWLAKLGEWLKDPSHFPIILREAINLSHLDVLNYCDPDAQGIDWDMDEEGVVFISLSLMNRVMTMCEKERTDRWFSLYVKLCQSK